MVSVLDNLDVEMYASGKSATCAEVVFNDD